MVRSLIIFAFIVTKIEEISISLEVYQQFHVLWIWSTRKWDVVLRYPHRLPWNDMRERTCYILRKNRDYVHGIWQYSVRCLNGLYASEKIKLHQLYNEKTCPESKVHGANMGSIWVLSAPDGPHEPCYQGGHVLQEAIHHSETGRWRLYSEPTGDGILFIGSSSYHPLIHFHQCCINGAGPLVGLSQ